MIRVMYQKNHHKTKKQRVQLGFNHQIAHKIKRFSLRNNKIKQSSEKVV